MPQGEFPPPSMERVARVRQAIYDHTAEEPINTKTLLEILHEHSIECPPNTGNALRQYVFEHCGVRQTHTNYSLAAPPQCFEELFAQVENRTVKMLAEARPIFAAWHNHSFRVEIAEFFARYPQWTSYCSNVAVTFILVADGYNPREFPSNMKRTDSLPDFPSLIRGGAAGAGGGDTLGGSAELRATNNAPSDDTTFLAQEENGTEVDSHNQLDTSELPLTVGKKRQRTGANHRLCLVLPPSLLAHPHPLRSSASPGEGTAESQGHTSLNSTADSQGIAHQPHGSSTSTGPPLPGEPRRWALPAVYRFLSNQTLSTASTAVPHSRASTANSRPCCRQVSPVSFLSQVHLGLSALCAVAEQCHRFEDERDRLFPPQWLAHPTVGPILAADRQAWGIRYALSIYLDRFTTAELISIAQAAHQRLVAAAARQREDEERLKLNNFNLWNLRFNTWLMRYPHWYVKEIYNKYLPHLDVYSMEEMLERVCNLRYPQFVLYSPAVRRDVMWILGTKSLPKILEALEFTAAKYETLSQFNSYKPHKFTDVDLSETIDQDGIVVKPLPGKHRSLPSWYSDAILDEQKLKETYKIMSNCKAASYENIYGVPPPPDLDLFPRRFGPDS